jgi:hypothetical protein
MTGSDAKAGLHSYLQSAREAVLGLVKHGSAGLQPGNDKLPSSDEAWWQSHRDRLGRVAQESARP